MNVCEEHKNNEREARGAERTERKARRSKILTVRLTDD